MWRRTHRWGLTRGVAVDRLDVQQRGKREREPQWTSKSTSSKSSAATTPRTWRTSWKTSKADPKAPAPAGAFPCPETAPRSPLGRLRGRGGATLPAKAREALRGLSAAFGGAPAPAGARQAGVRDADGGPEQLRNVGVAKIPESITCEVAHTFAKSGLRSQLEQPCEQSHTQKGSRATL